MNAIFWAYLFCSYCVGWALVAQRARIKGVVDLCQFVRAFLLAPVVLSFTIVTGFLTFKFVANVVIPNFLTFLIVIAIGGGSIVILGLTGYFVVKPAVMKAYGVAKPFSEKICIVLYRKNNAE